MARPNKADLLSRLKRQVRLLQRKEAQSRALLTIIAELEKKHAAKLTNTLAKTKKSNKTSKLRSKKILSKKI